MVQLGNVNICRPLYSGDGCTKIQVKINQSILNSYISIFTSKHVYFTVYQNSPLHSRKCSITSAKIQFNSRQKTKKRIIEKRKPEKNCQRISSSSTFKCIIYYLFVIRSFPDCEFKYGRNLSHMLNITSPLVRIFYIFYRLLYS